MPEHALRAGGSRVKAAVPSEELARVAANALAFLPARSKYKHARLSIGLGVVGITATDGYAVGSDHTLATTTGGGSVYVDREALAELDKAGRADKKWSGDLEVFPGDCLKFTSSDGTEVAVPIHEPVEELWVAVDGLFERLDGGAPRLPAVVALDPQLLMRFSKVKADKAERIADFVITDPEAPILVKIGPSFRGIIMPVNRGAHAALVGEDGLWDAA
jgi:hypothetical protein